MFNQELNSLMFVPEVLIPFIPVWNLLFFIAGVPFVLWLNNKTKNDFICLALGILYMILYGIVFEPPLDEWLFFIFGLVVGYVTDYWGVKSNKWKYHPWDPNFGLSFYVGFAWGMVTMFTYNISKSIPASIDTLYLPGILFVLPMFIFEYRYGKTRKDQYFLFARALFTLVAYYNNLGLLFLAIFVGSYIEWAGVEWIKNWLYIDTMSYIFISFGYSMMVLIASVLTKILTSQPVDMLTLIFLLLAIIAYTIDIFYQQKKVEVDLEKAIKAAQDYHSKSTDKL